MAIITSNNPKIKALIKELCNSLRDAGSFIAHNTEIKEIDGEISVFGTSKSGKNHLFRLPHDILIPYSSFDLDIHDGKIVIDHVDSSLSKKQILILELVIALCNETGKLNSHIETCPWLVFNNQPDITNILLAAREGEDLDIFKKTLHDPLLFDEIALFTFLKSRLLSCHLHDKSAKAQHVLVPVIDFLNHHPQGAGYNNLYHKEKSYLDVKPALPVENSKEFYANYGRFDALDTYIFYSFVDTYAQFVKSIPMHINIEGLYSLKIRAINNLSFHGQVPEDLKDLEFYLPRINIDQVNKYAECSHLIIPGQNGLFSLRRILEFILKHLRIDLSHDKLLKNIGAIEKAIIDKNLDFYNQSLITINSYNFETQSGKLLCSLLTDQRNKITEYNARINADR